MRSVCVVVKSNKNDLFLNKIADVSSVFTKRGYAFDELRFVPFEQNSLLNLIVELKNTYDDLLLICERKLLKPIGEILNAFPQGEFLQDARLGSGIYRNGKFSTMLVVDEVGESGVGFAENVCIPHLIQKRGKRYEKIVVRTVGAPENLVEDLILRAKRISGEKLAYNHNRKYDEDVIEIFYDDTATRMMTEEILRLFANELEPYVYALNDTTLEKQLVELLRLRGKRISVAESFTGGGVGRRIVSVSGASEVYFEGLNTYNELSKMKRLGVREYSLKSFGAVSDETAYEMSAGLIATGDADISIATTGIAGPKSDRTDAPVGLSFIAIGTKEKVHVYQFLFDGTREEITEKAINNALFLAYRQLKE